MSTRSAVDVVIAGGGVAGVAAAAALGEFGYHVLLVEPGLDGHKRLAGELIHPPGVRDLAELGLLPAVERPGTRSVVGFAVVADANADAHLLPYGELPGLRRHGFTIDHATLRTALLDAASALPHVTVSLGARVTGLDLDGAAATITINGPLGTTRLRTQLVVGADGATSNVRRLAGIGHTRSRISHMVGYVLRGARLPYPGFGNIFLGGVAPSLAYAIGDDAVRVMFDVPDNPDALAALQRNPAYLAALPAPFRDDVCAAIETQPRLVSVNHSVVPDTVIRQRLVLAGDAAGCCHPLTATGLTASTRDAIRLRDALRKSGGDIPAAARAYAAAREGPERTREALAEALYRAFVAQTPEMRLLRHGLLRFWKHSRRGRAASMALLSTHEGRMSRMALSYAHVTGHALIALIGRRGADEVPTLGRRRAVLALWRSALHHLYASIAHTATRRV